MSLFSGLMAGANFSQGYIQGQNQATQLRLQQQMQNLALQNDQLVYQQNQVNQQRAQAEADYSMSLFNPTISNPVTGKPIGGSAQQMSPQQYWQQMAQKAGQLGDPTGASQFYTNAMNAASQEQKNDLTSAQIGNEQLKRSAMLGQEGAQAAQMFDSSPQGAQQFLAYMQAQGNMTPQEFGNLQMAVKQLGPNWKQGIIAHGTKAMNGYQQAQLQNAQQRMDATNQYRQQELALRQQQLTQQKQQEQAREQARKNGGDAALKAPTKDMVAQAMAMIGQETGQTVTSGSSGEAQFSDPSLNTAAQDIASEAYALSQRNHNLTYRDALRQVIAGTRQAKMFPNKPNPPNWIEQKLGIQPGAGPVTYKEMGTSIQNAIPAQKGMTFIPGKIYTFNGPHGREYGRFNGIKFDPVQ